MEIKKVEVTEGVTEASASVASSDKVSDNPTVPKDGTVLDAESDSKNQIKALGPEWKQELKRKLQETQSRLAEQRKKVKDRKIVDLELEEREDKDKDSESASSCTRSAGDQSEIEDDGPHVVPEAIEVFCGKAGLTKELQSAGFAAVGIDCKANKDKPVAKVIWLDLTKREDQLQFWEMIRTGRFRYVPTQISSVRPLRIKQRKVLFDY